MPDFLVTEDVKSVGGTSGHEPATEPARPSPLTVWMQSEEALPYEGLWVLMNAALEPQDSDLSPTALKNRHADIGDPTIVYVPRRTVDVGV